MKTGLAVITALFCGGCSLGVPLMAPLSAPLADIPIEIRHRLPTVEVRVSGEPLRLFLDLGGHRAIALTSSELSRVAVRFTGASSEFRDSTGRILRSRQFIAKDVVLADFALGDIEGGESIFVGSAPPERNGYIGMPILGRYLLVADYAAKRVRLYRSGDSSALERECGTRTFKVAFNNGIAQTIGATDFGERLFLWDTGSTDNVISPKAVPADVDARRIDDGPAVVEISHLKLGDNDVGPQRFRLVPFGAPAVDAYFGYDLFAARRVCLDIPRGIGAIADPS